MRIATYNVNGVNGRLPALLRWLKEDQPDIVCLQELKAPQEKFPEAAIRDLGYEAMRDCYRRVGRMLCGPSTRTRKFSLSGTIRTAFARNAGIRIDHFLLSPKLAKRLVDAQVDRHVRTWEKTSDHAPVWIELSDKPSRRKANANNTN